jgi:hypothetical protein
MSIADGQPLRVCQSLDFSIGNQANSRNLDRLITNRPDLFQAGGQVSRGLTKLPDCI